ncbi:hypothetical protein BDW72DRAFT_21571 [Aspergillus terricola var. indicus]
MPATQMDALGAFTYLSDNLPTWISRLADLTAHTAAKNAEFAEAFKQHSAPSKPRRRRNSSVCSIQTDSFTPSHSHSQLGVKRRRATNDGSVDSCNGPTVISTRHNLIIHYDGYTQKTLEEMVRNIGTARNNLRKGKMAQLPLAIGSMRSPSRNTARTVLPALDSGAPEGDLLASIRTARARGPPVPQAAAKESPFDLADKNLELAHSFCETAAYHFIRAGGCASELESVKDRFTVLLKIATEEVQRLREEQEAKKKEQLDEKKEADASTKVTITVTETSVSSKRPASSEGPIEVDDDQGSVESIDLTAFRVGRLRR